MTYFGKYRGKVMSTIDPLQQGRLQVSCPALLGDNRLMWAMPCVPYAGPGVGWFFLPPVGANIWLEFEGGDLDYPIWSGCFWGTGEAPVKPAVAETKVLKTDGVTLTINTLPGAGGLALEIAPTLIGQPFNLKCSAQGVAMSFANVQFKLSLEGIQMEATPASLKVAPAGVEISVATATAKVAPASLELGNGAASVKLSPISVSINNGALEVT
jgi:hypothetical protein